jgi:hypothetical protein
MKKRYQIDQQRAVQQFHRLATEQNPNIQMVLPLAEIVGLMQQGVGNLLRQAGLALMHLVMDEEVKSLAGERHQQHEQRRAHRWARKTATAWWMARRCRSSGRDCAAATVANNAWGATNCFSATGLCSKASGTR